MRAGAWVAAMLVLAALAGCLQTQDQGAVDSPGALPQPGTPGGQTDHPDEPAPTEPGGSDEPSDPAEPPDEPNDSGHQAPPGNETPEPPSATPPPANRFNCGGETVIEEFATHGSGDLNVGSLHWAALKTGYRFAVAWTTEGTETGKLEYAIGGGAWVEATEGSMRKGHVIILDDLPLGNTICFRAITGAGPSEMHAARLANAMNAYDAASGTYTLNLLTLASEVPHEGNLETGYRLFAQKLWDATDGHVRVGTNIIVYADLDNHNSGWVTCYMVTRVWSGPMVGCAQVFDVVFSHESDPRAAAFTYLDGIQEPDAAVWMNQLHEANRLNAMFFGDESEANEVAYVLLHEIGHYVFGAMDLYGATPVAADCWDEQLSLSVMGGDRDATEFDDDVHTCPNAQDISGYESSWSRMRERFPMIPDRPGAPDPGPEGDGNAASLAAIDASPF